MNPTAHREYLKVLMAEKAEAENRLADLQRKSEEIKEKYVKLQAELDESRRLIRFVATKAGEDPSDYARDVTVLNDGIPVPPDPRPVTRPHAEVILEILREAGRPLKVQEIVDAVKERGQPLPDDPKLQYSAVYAAMRRRRGRDFENDETRGWSLLKEEHRKESGTDDDPADQHGETDGEEAEIDEGESPTDTGSISYADAAETVIKELGRPARVPEIVDWMIERGYREKSKRKHVCNTLHNMLRRSDRFYALQPGLFGLVTGRARAKAGVPRDRRHES
jgi:hypothetical protein